MSKVLVFKETVLPPSETFILSQMNALERYDAQLSGLERSQPSLPLKNDIVLLTDSFSGFAKLRAKIYRRTGIAPRFHNRARRLQPDLIHAHFASGGHSALPLARSLKVPLVVTLHGADITVRAGRSNRYAELMKQAALFLCVSAFIKDRALEAGFPEEKLRVHYIGIDRELFSPPTVLNLEKRVLFVGRLVEKKGCEYLLRAMQIVQKEDPDCALTIIGDGPLRARLQALAEELEVRCDFMGAQPATTVHNALSAARVLCAPSVTAANGDSEGLPIAIAEAQAMGVPVVGSIHAGIPEIVIGGVTGLLAAERDTKALASALSTLLHDDSMWSSFHEAAPIHIKNRFDIRAQAAVLEDIYDSLLASVPARRYGAATTINSL